MMKFLSLCFYITLLHISLLYVPLLSQVPRNHCVKLYYSSLKNAKLEITWRDKVLEDVTLRRKSLNIILSKTRELALSLPAASNKTDYLQSFPNRFALAHRLAKVWPLFRTLLAANYGDSIKRVVVPASVSLVYESALQSLVRLQETYNLTTESLARGEMEGGYPHTAMTAASIVDVALFYHRLGHPWRAGEWLLQALGRSAADDSVSRRTILEHLHIVNCYAGDYKSSIEFLTKLIEEFPSFSIDKELQEDYNLIANTSCSDISNRLARSFFDDDSKPHYIFNQANLCDPALYKPPSLMDPRLRCRLVHYNKLHLRLAPYKVEEMNLDPPVLLFHDVIHDSEIETIKGIYYNKTQPAYRDYNGREDRYFDTQYNIWLVNATDPVTRMIDRRAASTANAALYKSEPPMVASYGVGAEIKLHDDLIPNETYLLSDEWTRPDYISFLFYLNDVAEGGYTIFPYLELAVVPVQGAALVWHNRLPDWSRDKRTLHSGCPVLRGSKWIINKWFHVRGQYYPKCYPGETKSRMYYYLPDSL